MFKILQNQFLFVPQYLDFMVLTSYSISLTSQRMPNVGAENWLGGNLSIKINNHWEFNLKINLDTALII